MKAFNSWVGRKSEPAPDQAQTGFLRERLMGQTEAQAVPAAHEMPAEPSPAAYVPAPEAAPEPMHDGRTRLLGFDRSDGTSTDVFADAPDVASTVTTHPAGWLLVTEGPGRGTCFTLFDGMMKIGRGEDQAIRLNFGDTTISRDNHAAILFDLSSGQFWLGHGGKANIVRINQRPLISDQSVSDGDVITIGETTLQLKTFCGPHFNWETGPTEEEELQNLSLG